MATRTIVTAQPDVMCHVCERRLLRGEQPDVFLDAGRRRIVCELCAPRAAFEGWLRESDRQALELPPMRPRRGRSLFARLPAALRARPSADEDAADSDRAPAPPSGYRGDAPADDYRSDAPVPAAPTAPVPAAPAPASQPEGQAAAPGAAGAPYAQADADTAPAPASSAEGDPALAYMQDALVVFNASEFPRRVAGVARSLGAPLVSVRSAEHLSSVVSIVVAWELCWYRYQVDLSEPLVEAQLLDQGTELAELAREDRLANATAADSGLLALAAA